MSSAAVEVHRFYREEYEQMAAAGLLGGPEPRVELLEGIVYDMSPQNARHATAVVLANRALTSVFREDTHVRVQLPLTLGDLSAPEPDLAVVPGDVRAYARSHPATALLVVEIADHSLQHDRQRKLPLYARAGIPEVWLLDLTQNTLEVHRDPEPAHGIWRTRQVLRAGDTVSPISRPEARIAVSDLLP